MVLILICIDPLDGRKKENLFMKKGQVSESSIAAKCGSKILAPICFRGTCSTELINLWTEQFLLPNLKRLQVIILDNATFHKSEKS